MKTQTKLLSRDFIAFEFESEDQILELVEYMEKEDISLDVKEFNNLAWKMFG